MDTPDTLAADMLKAAGEAIVGTRAIVKKSAQNVKTNARKNVAESAPVHNAHAQYAITYESKVGPTSISAEIGYDKQLPGGSLGNLLEYGSAHNSPHRDLGRAADVEEKQLEDALPLFVGKLL